MHAAVARRDYGRASAIWAKLGPLARHCWRAPIRDYRPRMKEVLKLQGLFPHATVREPQLGVDDAERAAIARLVRAAGLADVRVARAADCPGAPIRSVTRFRGPGRRGGRRPARACGRRARRARDRA